MQLTIFQKRLCNAIQTGLDICEYPFFRLAEKLGADQQSVIENLRTLQNQQYLKHIRALINYKAVGRKSTLVTAHVKKTQLKKVTEKINSLANVSHNYLRNHYYNLWFTLQGDSLQQLESKIAELSSNLGIHFHSLPALKTYKLDTRFDIAGNSVFINSPLPLPSEDKINLCEHHFTIIKKLQKPLPLVKKPFADFDISQIRSLYDKNLIRRIAGILNYRKLGFTENILLAVRVDNSEIDKAGCKVAKIKQVSHCYHRRTFEDFDYNLFAMIHGETKQQVQSVIEKITALPQTISYQQLPTTAELKKKPVCPN
jgi:DNA-binding Lrp family transcriptional regulator